jgi:ABC-2 type transport system permease protein
MTAAWLIARREVQSFLLSPFGYVIVAVILLIDGLLFNAYAMSGDKTSFEVLERFFWASSGTTMVASVFVSMRTFAEERQTGTILLLETSPAAEWQIVLGKFLGAWTFLLGLTALTVYMPLLVLVNGKVTWGHLFAGYVGLALLGGACVALGVFASSLAKNQILAAVVAGALIVALVLMWMLARRIDGPLGEAIGYLDLFDRHFRSFSRGVVKAQSVLYYASICYVALIATAGVLAARRWRG